MISIFIWIGIRDCVSGLEILTKDWDFGLIPIFVIRIGNMDW